MVVVGETGNSTKKGSRGETLRKRERGGGDPAGNLGGDGGCGGHGVSIQPQGRDRGAEKKKREAMLLSEFGGGGGGGGGSKEREIED